VEEKVVTSENFTHQDYLNLRNAFLEKQSLMEEKMWIDASVAAFNEELQNNYGKTLNEFAKIVLNYLSKNSKAYKGLFYIVEEDNIKSIAGYGTKSNIILKIGEGTVGQAVESREIMFFEKISPKSIMLDNKAGVSISASAMIVLPLIFSQKVYGAVELLFVNDLPKKYYEFLSRITTNVAATLESIVNYFNTKSLLDESIKTSQILQAAEEELRQNFEELEATQQQMLVAQKQLEHKNHLIDALLSSSHDGILILDKELNILLFNFSAVKLLGLDIREHGIAVGQKMKHLAYLKEECIQKALAGENVTFENQDSKDRITFIAVTIYPIKAENEILGCGIMLKDITFERMRENTLVMQNKKMQSNEAVLKKSFEKMKKAQEELQAANLAQKVIEEELRQSTEELSTQRDAIAYTLNHLEMQAGRINDSIRYAERMQKGILPNEKDFDAHFKDYFVIFNPKDVVSGDFYWLLNHENYTFLAVADCTGHGVPGAFMSMIGNTLLNEIVFGSNILSPAGILEALNHRIRTALNQDNSDGDDGMDIAVCRLRQHENKNYEVLFSGAKINLIIQKKSENAEVLKADRISLGGRRSSEVHKFSEHHIILQAEDRFLMMTDGLADMANEMRKRFGSKRIVQIFEENSQMMISDISGILQAETQRFLGRGEQRDDVTVVGIELK
jgi:serine phosphatase RsbU (regulator of sigma subunit)/PAS domain-containing protein